MAHVEAALAPPTRRDEAWRYSDLAAVARLWPLPAPERIVVPAGEAITHVIVPEVAPGDAAVRELVVELGAGARADFHLLIAGGALNRVSIDVTLAEGAHFELGAAMLGGGEQVLELVTVARHIAPRATSNQIVRSALGGRATGSFLGRIEVARDAQHTDAAQSVKAMLLSRAATANAKPELEIFADDVKCAHGAAVGQLDAAALFYLMSRGIAPAEAKALLLHAFIDAAFAGVEDEGARAAIVAAADAALEPML